MPRRAARTRSRRADHSGDAAPLHTASRDGAPRDVAPVDEAALRAYADELGALCARAGLPPAAGRILAWLLVAEAPEQSSLALQHALGVSAGTVSTTTRFLAELGLVESRRASAGRHTVYALRPGGWSRFLADRTMTVYATRKAAERGLALLAGTPPARRARLREMYTLYRWWEDEARALFNRWEAHGGRPPPDP